MQLLARATAADCGVLYYRFRKRHELNDKTLYNEQQVIRLHIYIHTPSTAAAVMQLSYVRARPKAVITSRSRVTMTQADFA